MSTNPPPRRNWHLARWFLLLLIATFGWSGWLAYAFRSAIAQAKALGWTVYYTDPVEEIRKNWRAAFKKETWMDGVTAVGIPTSEEFEHHLAIIHRLNPLSLRIDRASSFYDLSRLEPRPRLKMVSVQNCTRLTNAEALKEHHTLQSVYLSHCTDLTNVDALKNLSALEGVALISCSGLTNVDALKSLPALRVVNLSGCVGLTNVDGLNNLPALQSVDLTGCTGLTNVDGLKNVSGLHEIWLNGCTGLTNVDGLKNHPALHTVTLTGCTLSPETVAELKAALPNTQITGP